MRLSNSFFVVEIPKRHKHHRPWWEFFERIVAIRIEHGTVIPHFDMAILVHWLWRSHMPATSFSHPQGDSHLYQLAILKDDGSPGTSSTDIVYTVDNPTIASVIPNNAVPLDLQCTVLYLAPGTATISATGTDELGNTFTAPVIAATVTAVKPNLSSGFSVSEIS